MKIVDVVIIGVGINGALIVYNFVWCGFKYVVLLEWQLIVLVGIG